MARHLAEAGHPIAVYNRTASKALAWVALHGNRAAPTPAEAADGANIVLLCVGNDDDVREVVLGEGGLPVVNGTRKHLGRPHPGIGRPRSRTCCRMR